ncbi:16S rRNA (cytosine(967)-C(5))-methyltransferase RsmB [Clostridium botulinum]|uniref:16S rRNA (cytosine(967)-C(5))-methyltransferase RsmB n=1 Tax=Clostridium botulinum TaxID=1491 RepID=UPI0001F849D8|nr:16S rRNA (cytosine(967)-C(5))-methyltransferase RsmB [Clostridium botulinum]NFB17118.1 16S rRNA (cytosine(967)-C(5))-methyltransferase RsmB [Clostridium botulinum]NFB69277.1 16S rRNA (cytosine(967)-C(5))-methyltransferase RsmB [Clostridium botulinum]NFB98782.1 16S rRNA (cytosine(967)-C(5))-methyltransferase RsmB [Clostridium botulinum]NFC48063.1 16S rRNA (cytosine(967)-C(5))-methyltransferase RsmB [Clostridium botulinum]NFC58507.1 16S rRNA (cytosine(967)-C(5))-methyltransferase RsmB [Clostr
MDNAREVALDVLKAVLFEGAYSNIVLSKKLNKSNLKDNDKALITEIVYGTLKYKETLDIIIQSYLRNPIKTMDKNIVNILRITIYQIRYLDKIPSFAAVNEAVEMSKKISIKYSKLVNGVLRNYIRTYKNKKFYDHRNNLEKFSFMYSYPKWLIKMFISQYGIEIAEKILKGLNERPNITVRVNNLKIDYDEAFEKLGEYGYNIEEGYICPEAIQIIKGKNIEKNPLFIEGNITVQDESAMLVAPSMELDEESIVLDLCSAPGGKTTHISEIMNNKSKVYAYDVHQNKLSLIESNAKRLGIKNIETDVGDAAVFNKKLKEKAHRVLMDVPCSGLGIIRKKPEIKWTKNEREIKNIIAIQRKIMNNGASYLEEGGILLYSTCTLNKEENEENINWFLKKHKNFKIEPLYYGDVDNIIYHKEGFVSILPNDKMDGFFIAKLKKC